MPPTETAHSSGTSANQAKTERQGGIGPASGNGNSSKPADKPAAAHNFQEPDDNAGCANRFLHTGASLSHRASEREAQA